SARDVEAAPDEAFLISLDDQPGIVERLSVLGVGEECDVVPLRERLDALRSSDEVDELHHRKTTLKSALAYAGDLQLRLIDRPQVETADLLCLLGIQRLVVMYS